MEKAPRLTIIDEADPENLTPEILLMYAMIDRGWMDLHLGSKRTRKEAAKWFRKPKRLLPDGIGYGDILDHTNLHPRIIKAIADKVYEIC